MQKGMGSRLKWNLIKWVNEYIASLRNGEKKLPKDALIIIFLSGVLLYVITIPTNNNDGYFKSYSLENNSLFTAQEDEETESKNKVERDLEEFLSSIDGVGQVKALIYFDEQEKISFSEQSQKGKISGVVIAAEGANSEVVRGQIIHLVMVLYGLNIDNVEVFVLKK